MTAAIYFANLQKSYGDLLVLQSINGQIHRGEVVAIIGSSGCGKSTLLRCFNRLETVSGGQLIVNDIDLSAANLSAKSLQQLRAKVGMVFQQFNLIPSLTVGANISFQAALSGTADSAYEATLADALGLSDQLSKYPEALSGGQQQRVAIARALAARPKLLLADEPTGNLDEHTGAAVLEQMLDLVRKSGTALMVVTHSPTVAARMDRTLKLSVGKVV